jgi:hypothetical protein
MNMLCFHDKDGDPVYVNPEQVATLQVYRQSLSENALARGETPAVYTIVSGPAGSNIMVTEEIESVYLRIVDAMGENPIWVPDEEGPP